MSQPNPADCIKRVINYDQISYTPKIQVGLILKNSMKFAILRLTGNKYDCCNAWQNSIASH